MSMGEPGPNALASLLVAEPLYCPVETITFQAEFTLLSIAQIENGRLAISIMSEETIEKYKFNPFVPDPALKRVKTD